MSIQHALETIDIVIAGAPVDPPDAWVPMRYGALAEIHSALRRAARLEKGLIGIISDLQASLSNGAAPGTPSPSSAPAQEPPTDADPSDTDVLSDHDWLQLADAELGRNYAGYLAALGDGTITWRKLENDTQTNIILWMLWVLHRKHDRVTGPIWDRHRPHGMIKAAAMYNRMPFDEWVELALAKYAGLEAAGDDFRED